MKIGGYSYNVGPSKMIDGIGKAAEEEGHEFVGLESQKSGIEQFRRLQECNVVLLGASAENIYEEVNVARRLFQRNIPYVFVEDVDDIRGQFRGNTKDALERAHGRVVAFENRVQSGAKDLYLGPPDHWKESYVLMTGAEERRKDLTKTKNNGPDVAIKKDDIIICIPGIRSNPKIMNDMIKLVRNCATEILGERLVMAVNQHPGETNEAKLPENKEVYRLLFEQRKKLLSQVWSVSPELLNLPTRTFLNPEIIGASNLTVFAGKPTEAIIAAFARKPSIYYSEFLHEMDKRGNKQWFLVDSGGCSEVEYAEEMPSQLKTLLNEQGYSDSIEAMKQANFDVPPIEEWHTSQNIVRALPELIV